MRDTDSVSLAIPMRIQMWTLVNVTHHMYEHPQPACGVMEPHNFHDHTWMDQHFKMYSRWCNGICQWCFREGMPEDLTNLREQGYRYGLHGNGAHK